MKIITVNLPESDIKAIDNLIGEKAIYPSRIGTGYVSLFGNF